MSGKGALQIRVTPVAPPVNGPDAVRTVLPPCLESSAKLMLSLLAGAAWAIKSVFGSEVVPPGFGVVTVIANVPAVAISEAGMEALSSFGLTNVVRRALPLTLTTALGANPPPFTVRVNAGPPVATIDGEIEVISMPMPVSGALCGEPGPLSETLMVADSLPTIEGVNARPTSHKEFAARANEVSDGQGMFALGAAVTNWKSALFVPPIVKPVASTLRGTFWELTNVTLIVGLVVPIPTGPKFTGVTATVIMLGTPMICVGWGLPAALSLTFRVALLTAAPGGVPAVYVIPNVQPGAGTGATVPPLKLQGVPVVGATIAKLAAFVPVIVAAFTAPKVSVAPPGLLMVIFVVAVVVPRFVGPRTIGDGLTRSTGLGFAVMVKGNEVAGVGPPPGSGLVIVTVTGTAIVRRETGTGTLKPVPPPVTVPPLRGTPLKVTTVPLTKLGAAPPENCSVTGVYVVVVLGVMLVALRTGFITANGAATFSAPWGSLRPTRSTCPSVSSELLTETVNCVVLTKVGVSVVETEFLSVNMIFVFVLKLPPVTVTGVVGSPTLAAAGVREVKNAIDGGFSSVS